MAPAAGGFKLFGKVIMQCAAEGAPHEASRPVFARERPDPDDLDQPTVKRDHDVDCFDHKPRGGGGPAEGGESNKRQEASSAPPLPCPRCRSRNTKFCYFNNYNVNQPRHFCKDCHRYWTAGGALRNVPIGAGRRKNRPLGPVVATLPAHHHHNRAAVAAAAGFPNSPTSPSPVYADRWPVCPDGRF